MIAGEIVVALIGLVLFWIGMYVAGWIVVTVLVLGVCICQEVAEIYRGGRKWLKQWGM
jgi:hypothetical protein